MELPKSDISRFNQAYLFLSIVWPPLQTYFLHVDGAGRTIFALSVLALILNSFALGSQAKMLHSSAFRSWMCLLVFSIVNSMIKGFVAEGGAFSFFKTNYINPFAFLYVLILELDWDMDKGLRVLFYALLTYVLLGVSGMEMIIRGDYERMMAEGLGNLLPLHATCLVFVSGLLYRRQRLSVIVFWLVVALAIYVTVLSGTRKALGAILILLAGVILRGNDGKGHNVMYFVRIALFLLALYWGADYILDNTMIGERFAGTADESGIELTDNESANVILNTLLGDRVVQYEIGYTLFRQHPLTGIGITNFIPVSGFPYRLHTEYMVQLCENGIIGFSLLMLFYFLIIMNLLRRRTKYGENITLLMFGLFAILFLNVTAWTYCTTFGMIFYGILIVYAYSNKTDVKTKRIFLTKNA